MNYKSITRKKRKVKKVVKSRKYIKKRRSTYKYRNKTQNLRKKRTSVKQKHTRRKMYGGEGECDTEVITTAAITAIESFPKGFKTFIDILEKCPDIMKNETLKNIYKEKIELKHDNGQSTGYLGLLGLQLINYLHARIIKLRKQLDNLKEKGASDNRELLIDIENKIESLKTAISLMDQVAAAPGITEIQLVGTIKARVDTKYYDCYVELYNKLASELKIKNRMIPLSTSACDFSQSCDSDQEVCGTCCIPDDLDNRKRHNPQDYIDPKRQKY
jgi:hypothetical protein